MSVQLLYVTCSGMEEARRIAALLLEEGRIACANILPGMRALYRWEGQLREDEECVLLLKTRSELAEEVREAVVRAHSYDVPAVLVLDVAGGYPPFLEWVREQTCGKNSE
jgi:periplasmic divalent cation tolerance protein